MRSIQALEGIAQLKEENILQRHAHFSQSQGQGIWVIKHRLTKSHSTQDALCSACFQAVHLAKGEGVLCHQCFL